MAAVRDLVTGTELETITLKGVQRPIRVFEINQLVDATTDVASSEG
jgi:class 3 adenylate cyclase